MAYVLGIDPSITATGVCLIHDNKAPEYFTIGAKSGMPLGKRLWHLSCLLASCLPTGTTPLLGAIERAVPPLAYGPASGGKGYVANCMAYAMAYEMLGKFKISYVELSPKQRAMVATGGGNSNKAEVVASYYSKVDDSERRDDNQIDAYWLAYGGWEVLALTPNEKLNNINWWLELNDKTYDMLESLEIQNP